MIDIFARLLISAAILIGTAYLPTLSAATGLTQAVSPDGGARSRRACPSQRETTFRACAA